MRKPGGSWISEWMWQKNIYLEVQSTLASNWLLQRSTFGVDIHRDEISLEAANLHPPPKKKKKVEKKPVKSVSAHLRKMDYCYIVMKTKSKITIKMINMGLSVFVRNTHLQGPVFMIISTCGYCGLTESLLTASTSWKGMSFQFHQ